MALFDRVDSGFPELDEALDYFRIGDNVVCRLTELDDFRLFAEARDPEMAEELCDFSLRDLKAQLNFPFGTP